jgi:hypothetical protein
MALMRATVLDIGLPRRVTKRVSRQVVCSRTGNISQHSAESDVINAAPWGIGRPYRGQGHE